MNACQKRIKQPKTRMFDQTYKPFYRFLSFLRPYWKKGVFAFFLMLLSVCLTLPMPFLSKYLIDKVLPTASFSFLNTIAIIMIAAMLLQAFTSLLQSILLIKFRGRVLFDIQIKLFDHVQKLPMSFFHEKETGYLMSRISNDVDEVEGLLANTLIAAVRNLLTFIAGIICTLYLQTNLALICFAILGCFLISLAVFGKRIRQLSSETREKFALVEKDIQELLSGISLIKAFSAEGRSTLKFLSGLKKAIRTGIKMDITATLAGIIALIISSISPLIVMWYGCAEIMRGNLTIGGLVAFNVFISFLFGPLRSIHNLTIGVQRSLAAVIRIFEILDVVPEKNEGKQLIIENGEIEFKQVNFSYKENKPVLKNISLKILSNQIVVFAGRSGAGKTTLISLLQKHYKPDSGIITIDGQNIANVKTSSLRDQIGIVPQDTFLFSDTIEENIRLGKPNATQDEIHYAAQMANADIFIEKLPNGYETQVGQRGQKLSGGERQRIAIARAILKNPKLFILDEATSNVDAESDSLIQDAVKKLAKNKTILIIAHRFSTIQSANSIFLLDEGKIIERGTHNELLLRNDLYRTLYTINKNQ